MVDSYTPSKHNDGELETQQQQPQPPPGAHSSPLQSDGQQQQQQNPPHYHTIYYPNWYPPYPPPYPPQHQQQYTQQMQQPPFGAHFSPVQFYGQQQQQQQQSKQQLQMNYVAQLRNNEEGIKRKWEDRLSWIAADTFTWSTDAWSRLWPKDAFQHLQEQFEDPGKETPDYIAVTGSSGSGKTTTMLYLLYKVHTEKVIRSCKWSFRLFISCDPGHDQSLFEYVVGEVRKSIYTGFNDQEVVREVLGNTALLLVLDEVPNRWKPDDYRHLSLNLKVEFGFSAVVLIVGSTALNQEICRSKTFRVANIRMGTIRPDKRSEILAHHLMRDCVDEQRKIWLFVDKLLEKIPYLDGLLGNHRCAFLTAEVLKDMFGTKCWDEKLDEGSFEGNLEYLLIKVADEYRARNGLRNLTRQECRTWMLQSLALVASQKCDVRVVDTHPKEGSLAMLSKKLVEYGLVERPIAPDSPTDTWDRYKVAVSGRYEFVMTPAVTLVCVGFLFPWIGGIRGPAERFEALVAAMLVVLRYAQTNVRYPIHRLRYAVPCSGNETDETDKYYRPSIRSDEICLINGPNAPFADVLIAGVPPSSEENPLPSDLMRALSKLVNESKFPAEPLLVQCKHTSNESANCCFKDDYAKMGFHPNGSDNPSENPYPGEKSSNQYRAANLLKRAWLYNDSNRVAVPAFATNKEFSEASFASGDTSCAILMQKTAEAEYAWEQLYPFMDIFTDELKGDVCREEMEMD